MEFSRVFVSGTNFKDPHQTDTSNKHLVADIVVIDQSDPTASRPLLYQMKQSAAATVKDSGHCDPAQLSYESNLFTLLGDVLKVDKRRRLIYLSNDKSVSYNYLIIVSGTKSSSTRPQDHAAEFLVGIQALTEAMKIRKKGLAPSQPKSSSPFSAKKDTSYTSGESTPHQHVGGIAQQAMDQAEEIPSSEAGKGNRLLFEVHL